MKDMLRRPVNSKPPNARKLSPPNLTGTPNQVSTVCAAREITTIKFQQILEASSQKTCSKKTGAHP